MAISSQNATSVTDGEAVIVSAADEKFFPGLLVTLCSVAWYANRKRRLRLVVFDGGVSDTSYAKLISQVARIRADVQFERHKIADYVAGYAARDRLTSMTYARLWIPELVKASRALYLDADVLVLSDVAPLLDLQLDGCVAAAARDPGTRLIGSDCPWIDSTSALSHEPYFNAGVLLFDLDAWRQTALAERTLKLLSTDGVRCFWGDQTALNYLLSGQIRFVPDRWNFATARYVHRIQRPVNILHFMWPVKPWLGSADSDAYVIWRTFAERVAGYDCLTIRHSPRSRLKAFVRDLYPPLRLKWEKLKQVTGFGTPGEARHWKKRAIQAGLRRRSHGDFIRWLKAREKEWGQNA